MPGNGEPKSRAVLIDAGNTSAPYARASFEEIVKLGEANVRRIDRDFPGSRILGAAPDFDPRTYGCANVSTLVAKSGRFEVGKEPGKPVFIRRKPAGGKAAARDQTSA